MESAWRLGESCKTAIRGDKVASSWELSGIVQSLCQNVAAIFGTNVNDAGKILRDDLDWYLERSHKLASVWFKTRG